MTQNDTKMEMIRENEVTEQICDPVVIECKQKICEIITFGIKLENEEMIKRFVSLFRTLIKECDDIDEIDLSEFSYDKRAEIEDLKENQHIRQIDYYTSSEKKEGSSDLNISLLLQKIGRILEEALKMDNSVLVADQETLHILFGMINHSDMGLKTSAVKLMNLLLSRTQYIMDTVYNIQIVEDKEGIEEFKKIEGYAHNMAILSDSAEKWYHNPTSREFLVAKEIMNQMTQLIMSNKAKNKESEDEKSDRQDFMAQPMAKSSNWESNSIQMMTPKQGTELDEIHRVWIEREDQNLDKFYQNIFKNYGVALSMINILKYDADTETQGTREGFKFELVHQIYILLSIFCKRNPKNQEWLTSFLEEILLVHFANGSYDFKAEFLLRELFIDNK
jgi:hypothetical protein